MLIRRSPGPGLRVALGVLLLAHGASAAAAAQNVFSLVPSLTTSEMYDSNVFFTPANRQMDLITRVTPAIASEYRSPLWRLTGRYSLDAERFAHHSALSRANAQQHGAAGVEYRPGPRLTLALAAEFARTRTPGELVPHTGLSFGRRFAQRLGGRSSLAHRLNPVTTGTVDYAFTEDRIEGGVLVRTHDAAIASERRLSARDSLDLTLRSRLFSFGGVSAASHVFRVGWTRAVTERASVSIDGGPAVTHGTPGLDLAVSLRNRFGAGDVQVAYIRTPTAVFGLAEAVQTQSLSATASWAAGPWRLRVTPAFYQSELATLRADVYRLMVDAAWPLARGLSLETSVHVSQQRGGLYAALDDQIVPRHEAVIRIVAAPRSPSR